MAADLPGRELGLLRRRSSTGVPAASAMSWAWHERSMVMNHHAASSTVLADGEEAVVAEDGGLVVAEGVGDALALLEVEHDAGVVVEEGVVAVEGARRPG